MPTTPARTRRRGASHGATPSCTAPPGIAYVYFTYGNHHMLNFVCERAGIAGAVLVRAIEPLDGVDVMTSRRKGRPVSGALQRSGQAHRRHSVSTFPTTTSALGSGRISVYYGERPPSGAVATSGRVGLSAGHELELRYFVSDSPFVSRGPNAEPRGTRAHADHQGRTKT